MAKYICPSCGAPYNGKKCRNCAYESFSEEITHNLHVHEGEPLVIHDTTRRPVPYKDPFDCPPSHPKKKEKITIRQSVQGTADRFHCHLPVQCTADPFCIRDRSCRIRHTLRNP